MEKLEKSIIIIKKILYFILMIMFIILLIVSIIHIIDWNKDNKDIEKQISDIENKIDVKEIEDKKAEKINPEKDKNSLYFKFIKMPLIEVDFTELLKQNKDTVGWLQVKGTNVNYPFVQGKDNDYYLKHSFNKTKNDAGWVFMDYRNNKNDWDQNTIIYAHSRLDTSMFGTLKNIFKSDWLKNRDNHIIRISTEKENTMWQVFSVYKIKTTTDYLTTSFSTQKEYQKFLNMIEKRSTFDFKANVTTDDKIITLSTCYNDTTKTVMHAKLILRKKR